MTWLGYTQTGNGTEKEHAKTRNLYGSYSTITPDATFWVEVLFIDETNKYFSKR